MTTTVIYNKITFDDGRLLHRLIFPDFLSSVIDLDEAPPEFLIPDRRFKVSFELAPRLLKGKLCWLPAAESFTPAK